MTIGSLVYLFRGTIMHRDRFNRNLAFGGIFTISFFTKKLNWQSYPMLDIDMMIENNALEMGII